MRSPRAPLAGPLPLVSVIMPVRNEGSHIARSLGCVLAQDYPRELLEVLVADGRSDDQTRDVIDSIARDDARVRWVDNPGQVVATGLNLALAVARGDVIVRVDGHAEIASDYVRQCVLALERRGADNVGGPITSEGRGLFGRATALAMSSHFGVGGAPFRTSAREDFVDTVPFGAWRRQVFERIGLFDEELVRNQDDEFNYRLRASGGRILLSPLIRSRYTVRSTPRALWRQYFQYGYWKVRVLQKHALQMRPRQFVPPLFVGALLGAAGVSLAFPPGLGVLAGLGSVYAGANLAAALWTSRSEPWLAPLVALAFAILHLSYGLGFLIGVLRFWRHWLEASAGPALQPSIGAP